MVKLIGTGEAIVSIYEFIIMFLSVGYGLWERGLSENNVPIKPRVLDTRYNRT